MRSIHGKVSNERADNMFIRFLQNYPIYSLFGARKGNQEIVKEIISTKELKKWMIKERMTALRYVAGRKCYHVRPHYGMYSSGSN